MVYSLSEKLKVGVYAAGSAILTGTTSFGIGTAIGASTPLIITAVALGAAGDLLHTAHSTLNQIKKKQKNTKRDKEQQEDLEGFKNQLRALRPRIERLLKKEKAKEHHKRKAAVDLTALITPSKKPVSRRVRAKSLREDKLNELQAAFKKLEQVIIGRAETPHPKTPLIEPIIETPEEQQTNILGGIIQIGKGLFNGFRKAGAVTFGAIQTGAKLAGTPVSLLSISMVAPIVVVGALGAVVNAIQSYKEYASKLEEEEQYNNFRANKRQLQTEYNGLLDLLELLDPTDKKTIKRSSAHKSTISLLPGTVETPQPERMAVSTPTGGQGGVTLTINSGVAPASRSAHKDQRAAVPASENKERKFTDLRKQERDLQSAQELSLQHSAAEQRPYSIYKTGAGTPDEVAVTIRPEAVFPRSSDISIFNPSKAPRLLPSLSSASSVKAENEAGQMSPRQFLQHRKDIPSINAENSVVSPTF